MVVAGFTGNPDRNKKGRGKQQSNRGHKLNMRGGEKIVTKVSRNMIQQGFEKRHENSEIMTKPLLLIIEEMEGRTREALELAGELEKFFRSSGATAMKTTRETEESSDRNF